MSARKVTGAAVAFAAAHGINLDRVKPTAKSGVISERACRRYLAESMQRSSEWRGEVPRRFCRYYPERAQS